MSTESNQQQKTRLHPRNKNRERYDLSALIETNSNLKKHLVANNSGEKSVNFSNPEAVKLLNKALLNHYYGIQHWEFPDENLCPPIPGRADYLHYVADLLSELSKGKIPTGNQIKCLDIGTGASCIYPLIGSIEYNWSFVGSDIDPISIESAKKISTENGTQTANIECRLQTNAKCFFDGVIAADEKFDFTICNPPFHSSFAIAQKGTRRKVKNLSGKKEATPQLNFAGVANELVCEGGEYGFIQNMIAESVKFGKNFLWFSTLVSKQDNLKGIYKTLQKLEAKNVKTIPMGTGNKSTRIVAWTFLTNVEQQEWADSRWK